MGILKDKEIFCAFEKGYWNYFLELEEHFLSTKRYVAFERANFKTYSSEYLRLLEAVCSEIDMVGKEIAHQIDSEFKTNDNKLNIQKWWYALQEWFMSCDMVANTVSMLDEISLTPWDGYEIEAFTDIKGATRRRLSDGSRTPEWWKAYNNVKHSRMLIDKHTKEKNFVKANLGNICNALAALYLLEKKFMITVGYAEDYNRVRRSQLFEVEKPSFFVDETGAICVCYEDE